MAILPILHYPDPFLSQAAAPVETVTEDLRRLATDMAETMYAAPGVGLAAVQVGVAKRLVVVDCSPKDDPARLLTAFNPVILQREGELLEEEGCLSVPSYYARVHRSARVRVGYLNLEGQQVEVDFEGIWAIAFQHEIDHLEGILFVDHLSSLKRGIFRKKYQRILQQREEEL